MKRKTNFRDDKHKLIHFYGDAIEKLTDNLARFTKRKSITFNSRKDSITQEIDKALKF